MTKQSAPRVLTPVPEPLWKTQDNPNLIEVWRSKFYMVQIYQEGIRERLTITFAKPKEQTQHYVDQIPRNILMEIKMQVGRAGSWAIEVYPDLDHTVGVPQARHLLAYREIPDFLELS